jgi:hypothetical protein
LVKGKGIGGIPGIPGIILGAVKGADVTGGTETEPTDAPGTA